MLKCNVHSAGAPQKLNDKLVQDTIAFAHETHGGLRHLRNFAKKKGHVQILQRIIENAEAAKQTMAKNRPTIPAERAKLNAMISMQQDCTLPKLHIANSFDRERLPERFKDVDEAHTILGLQKDEFYKAQLLEMREVNKLQVAAYKASKGDKPELCNGSFADYIRARLDFKESKYKASEAEVKKLKTAHKVPDSPYACILFRAMVQDATAATE